MTREDMKDKHKCPNCPYYAQKTSYGVELVKCNNEKCARRESEE